MNTRHAVCTFETALGWMALVGARPSRTAHKEAGWTVARLAVGFPSAAAALEHAVAGLPGEVDETDWQPELVERIRRYAAGEPVDFSDVPIDVSGMTPFARRVLECCRRIPYGSRLSYAALAERAGSPRAARAVGNCMAGNTVPLVVPCHRVVASGGRLGGYSSPQGIALKQRLLEMEGRVASV